MKNKLWIILIIIVVVLFIVVFSFNSKSGDYLKEISYSELIDKLDKKETFILYLKQDECSHCAEFTPVFERVLQANEVHAYYLRLNILNDEQIKRDDDSSTIEEANITITGTPTVVFIKDGKESTMNRIVGSVEQDVVLRKLKNTGYIK